MTTSAPPSTRRSRIEAFVVSAVLLVLGQVVLLLLSPLTRAPRAQEGSSGPFGAALLSSDSLYYLRSAESLDVPVTRIVYPLVLRIGSVIGSAEVFAVLANMAALGIAGALLYDLGCRLGRGRLAGGLAAAALLLNPLTAQWCRFVLTETMMYSTVVAVLWAAERSRGAPLRHRTTAILLAAGVFAALLRPNGILVLASVLALLVAIRAHRPKNPSLTVFLLLSIGTGALLLMFAANDARGGETTAPSSVVIGLLYDGVVIEGSEHVLVKVPMPPAQDPLNTSFGAGVRFAVEHPIAVARLALLRVVFETSQVRRHYPTNVNIAIGIGFTTFLLLALIGRKSMRTRLLDLPVLLIAIPQSLLVAATFAVPEARYGWTYLVGLSAWVGIGAERVILAISSRIVSSSTRTT